MFRVTIFVMIWHILNWKGTLTKNVFRCFVFKVTELIYNWLFRDPKKGMSGLPYLGWDSLTFLDRHIILKHLPCLFTWHWQNSWAQICTQKLTVAGRQLYFRQCCPLNVVDKTLIMLGNRLWIVVHARLEFNFTKTGTSKQIAHHHQTIWPFFMDRVGYMLGSKIIVVL